MLIQQPIYLASASPRRHELLKQIDITHEVLIVPAPAGEDEPIHANESAIDYVQRTAHEKLEHAKQWHAQQPQLYPWPILCADTTVELQGQILAKPKNLQEAKAFLQLLSGQEHHVHTAVCLSVGENHYKALSTSTIRFKPLSPAEIDIYCQSQEPLGKAGAYGIQGMAAAFVTHLTGSYSGVMGLDLHQTYQLLLNAGLK